MKLGVLTGCACSSCSFGGPHNIIELKANGEPSLLVCGNPGCGHHFAYYYKEEFTDDEADV